MPSDEELLSAWYQGDAQAFEELERRLEPFALTVARCRGVLDVEERRDLAQEALFRVVRTRDGGARFDPTRATVRAWFAKIVERTVVDGFRRNRRVPGLSETGRVDPPDPTSGTEERAVLAGTLDDLRECLRGLVDPYRRVLLRRMHGESLRSIAESERRSVDWVHEKETTAKRRLRRDMEARGHRGPGR